MAPAQVAVPSPYPNTTDKAKIVKTTDNPIPNIQTVDGLIRQRAKSNPGAIAVAYPRAGTDYVDYTLQQLDVFAYRVAVHYQKCIPSRKSSVERQVTVALFGPSNFDYLISMLALAKLGHTVLFLSTRLSQIAIESLVETTGTTYLLADQRFMNIASAVHKNKKQLNVSEIADSEHYDFPIEIYADTRLDYHLDASVETKNNIFIVHSSGMCAETLTLGGKKTSAH
jgi:acyl-CoA synthetase (AMP-forming)/AMP-acid ligase II